jgi:hypothetical protein
VFTNRSLIHCKNGRCWNQITDKKEQFTQKKLRCSNFHFTKVIKALAFIGTIALLLVVGGILLIIFPLHHPLEFTDT